MRHILSSNRFNFLALTESIQGLNTKIRNRTFIRQNSTLTVHICDWSFNATQKYKQAIGMARTFSTNMFNPQNKAVWHHLKVAGLNRVILKKCHSWLRHCKCTHRWEGPHYFPYFFHFWLPRHKSYKAVWQTSCMQQLEGFACQAKRLAARDMLYATNPMIYSLRGFR